MRKYIVIILLLIISCKPNNEKPKFPKSNLSPEEWDDSVCNAESKKAHADIQKGILKYGYSMERFKIFNGNKELDTLLAKYHIKIDTIFYTCLAPHEKQNCYHSKMYDEIHRKHGKNFIDSLKQIAEMRFMKNNPDKVYDMTDCDKISRYPNSSGHNERNLFKTDFFQNFKYPKNFEYAIENEGFSYANVDFILLKDGTILNLEIETIFQNPKNNIFIPYVNKELEKFVKNINWVPSKKNNITVNSKVNYYISFK